MPKLGECFKPVPFLRWAGGKSKLVGKLSELSPPSGSYRRYIEPFLGSGALFFRLLPSEAILADANKHLINCFRQVKASPSEVWDYLQVHMKNHSKEYYLSIRRDALERGNPVERAAAFIYLNKAAFNGIFRVNRSGQFNVPYGPSQSGPAIPSKERLIAASAALSQATLLAASFELTCDRASSGDFVYLDPPYPPIDQTSYFTHYTANRFSMDDQIQVSKSFRELDRRGCLVMLSNSDQPRIRSLYKGFYINELKVTRWLGSNGKRYQVDEIVITNFDPNITR